jgi:hypothetical protein
MQKTSLLVLFLAGLITFGSAADLSLKQKLKGLS